MTAAPSPAFGSAWHAPVLVHEVVTALAGRHEVLDGTLGGGGHATALLEAGHRVTGIDRDPTALAEARSRLAGAERDGAFRAVAGNHDEIDAITELVGASFDAILLDLG